MKQDKLKLAIGAVGVVLLLMLAWSVGRAGGGNRDGRAGGRCVGSADCTACKTCARCEHCAKLGGTCGVKGNR